MTTPAPPSTHRPGTHVRSFVAFVVTADTAPQVRVRYRDVPAGWRWSCDMCGQHRDPICPHAQAAHYLTTPERRDLNTETSAVDERDASDTSTGPRLPPYSLGHASHLEPHSHAATQHETERHGATERRRRATTPPSTRPRALDPPGDRPFDASDAGPPGRGEEPVTSRWTQRKQV